MDECKKVVNKRFGFLSLYWSSTERSYGNAYNMNFDFGYCTTAVRSAILLECVSLSLFKRPVIRSICMAVEAVKKPGRCRQENGEDISRKVFFDMLGKRETFSKSIRAKNKVPLL